MKSLINPSILKKLKRDWNPKDKSDKFKDKIKVKLTKLGAKGTESPLFCKHEHCAWWQLKHYLIEQKAKEKAKEKIRDAEVARRFRGEKLYEIESN